MLKKKGVQKVDNDGENANSSPLVNHHPPDLRNNTPTKWIPGAVGTIRAIKPCYLIVQMAKLRPLKEEICPGTTLHICSRKARIPNQVTTMDQCRSCQQGALQPAHRWSRILEKL